MYMQDGRMHDLCVSWDENFAEGKVQAKHYGALQHMIDWLQMNCALNLISL